MNKWVRKVFQQIIFWAMLIRITENVIPIITTTIYSNGVTYWVSWDTYKLNDQLSITVRCLVRRYPFRHYSNHWHYCVILVCMCKLNCAIQLPVCLMGVDMIQSVLFTAPAQSQSQSTERFAEQLDSVMHHRRSGSSLPATDSHWLSKEAVDAKRERRRLERKWKTHHEQGERMNCRAACRTAN